MSGYNVRSRYDLRSVSGDLQDVAGNELDRQTHPPGSTPGFVVGHHPGHVTVDVRRRIRADLTSDQAHELGMLLLWAADLARISGAA
jgi:hypothetical protein